MYARAQQSLWRDNEGSALIEGAILLPLLLTFVLGVFEFSWLIYQQHLISTGIHDGARYIARSANPRDVTIQGDAKKLAIGPERQFERSVAADRMRAVETEQCLVQRAVPGIYIEQNAVIGGFPLRRRAQRFGVFCGRSVIRPRRARRTRRLRSIHDRRVPSTRA